MNHVRKNFSIFLDHVVSRMQGVCGVTSEWLSFPCPIYMA
jgi:hypothetical protein